MSECQCQKIQRKIINAWGIEINKTENIEIDYNADKDDNNLVVNLSLLQN